VDGMGHSAEAYCLITALCSLILKQPGIARLVNSTSDEPADSITDPKLGTILMQEAVRIRKGFDYVENPTMNTVIMSIFLFGSCFGLSKHNTAWVHSREATALAQILGMQEENTYPFGNAVATSRRWRLFWLLFVGKQSNLFLVYSATSNIHHSDREQPYQTTRRSNIS